MSAGPSPISQHRANLHRARLAVIPINHKQKAPKIKSWEKLTITADNAGTFFRPEQEHRRSAGGQIKGLNRYRSRL